MGRRLSQIRATFALEDVALAALICDSLVHTRGVYGATLSLKAQTLTVKFDARVASAQDLERLIQLTPGSERRHRRSPARKSA